MEKKHALICAAPICALISVLAISCSQNRRPNEALNFFPEEPLPGEAIRVIYSPSDPTFKDADHIQMLAYAYTVGLPTVLPVTMEKEGRTWRGTVTPEKDVFGVAIKFKAGDKFDNNKKSGYFIPLFTSDGDLVPGAMTGQAEALASWGDLLMKTESDPQKALRLFDAEFLAHPEMKKKFLYTYVRTLIQTKPESWEEIAFASVNEVASKADPEEDTLITLINCYRQLKNSEKQLAIAERAIEAYPQG
jgi:hypothetical protein